MAAELLDIEARLDTSQVQGQLNQLSKTSGLQNLDRAIRTLENSMKKLASAMERQAHSANTAPRTGGGDNLLGKDGMLLGRNPLARALGLVYTGRMLDKASSPLSRTYGWKAGALADIAGGAMKGAWMGPGGMAYGAVQAATDAVSEHFKELAEISEKLIAAKMKEWEATDKAFRSIEDDIKDIRMRTASASMSPEERRKEIDRLQTVRGEAVGNMSASYEKAKELEGPMYDAAVAAAKYWQDAVRDIDKNLSILQKDNDKYIQQLNKAARASAHATAEERRLTEWRERVRAGFAGQLRTYQHEQWKENAEERAKGMGEADLRGNIFTTQASLQKAQQKYAQTLKDAMMSDAPEKFVDTIKDMHVGISELKDALKTWQDALESRAEKMPKWNADKALGGLNAAEQAGYFTMAGKDRTIEDVTQQILTYVRQITTNTATTQSPQDMIYGYGV